MRRCDFHGGLQRPLRASGLGEVAEAKVFLESADETRVVQDCAVDQGLPHAKIDHSLHDLVKRCVGGHPGQDLREELCDMRSARTTTRIAEPKLGDDGRVGQEPARP